MQWTRTTSLVTTLGLVGAGCVWAGCNGDNTQNDGGTNDSGTVDTGNDVSQQMDTGVQDTGTTDASDAASDAPIAVDGSVLDCAYYCSSITSVCTGTNNQYKSAALCLTMCNEGIPNDAGVGATAGDSLACRMYHLSVASMSPTLADTHCPHAGPYGYGVCGDLCEDFCHQYFTSDCSGNTTKGYTNQDACRTYCSTAAGADAAAGAPGNSATTPAMLCREYHLENAVENGGDGGGHCDHAGQSGGNVCP